MTYTVTSLRLHPLNLVKTNVNIWRAQFSTSPALTCSSITHRSPHNPPQPLSPPVPLPVINALCREEHYSALVTFIALVLCVRHSEAMGFSPMASAPDHRTLSRLGSLDYPSTLRLFFMRFCSVRDTRCFQIPFRTSLSHLKWQELTGESHLQKCHRKFFLGFSQPEERHIHSNKVSHFKI